MAETLTIRGARWKSVLVMFGSVLFVWGALFLINGPVSSSSRYSPETLALVGYVGVAFFSLTALSGVFSIFRPVQVSLDARGFQVRGFRTKPIVLWSDVERFFIVQVHSTKIVSYELRPETKTALQRLGASRVSAWGDGSIPAHLEKSPTKMLSLLEDWRQRHAS